MNLMTCVPQENQSIHNQSTLQQERGKTRLYNNKASLPFLMMILALFNFTYVSAEPMDIFDHVIYENLEQDARTYSYYKLTLGQRYYETGLEHVTIKVLADDYFDSDPDVFISKVNEEPTSSLDSEWYCERDGSETCIIHNGEFEIGDTFYIGVKCDRACKYMLRAWFTAEIDLKESSRSQKRFDGYSTQILKYYIESETEDGATTESIEIVVLPEETYVPIDVHVSLDNNFYLIEEKPAPHITDNGVAVKFGESDYNWCVKCYVYIIVNIVQEGRYYITSQGRYENDYLSEYISTQVMVNPFTQECFGYFVLRTKEDLKLNIEGYNGHAEVYISPRRTPDDIVFGDTIQFRGGHGASREIILKSLDRSERDYATGTWWICFYAYTPFSGKITTDEKDLSAIIDFEDRVVQSQTIFKEEGQYGRYDNSNLNVRGRLHIYFDMHEGSYSDIVFRYRLCKSDVLSACTLDKENFEHLGEEKDGNVMQVLEFKDVKEMFVDPEQEGYIHSRQRESRYAFIDHDPEDCVNSDGNKIGCIYFISIQNTNTDDHAFISSSIRGEFYNPGDIYLDQSYINTIDHGQTIQYELNPRGNPDMAYLKKLKIKLDSKQGDADLYLSFTNTNPGPQGYALNDDETIYYDSVTYDLMSARKGRLDEIVIEEEGGLGMNSLNRTIYFVVFGFSRAQYEITFEYEFLDSHNELLENAKQIGDGEHIKEFLESEYDEGFYKFRPWWGKNENRTIVFTADVIYNKVFFYSQWNTYPKHFLTSKHDINDTIVYYGNDPDYHYNGDYYIRLRPDFALYDLLSMREYIYWMYAFSQPPANGGEVSQGFQLLELNVDQIGFSNGTYYQDYRYIIVDMTATFDITCTRIPGQGKPIFFVKMMNSQGSNYLESQLPRQFGYHYKSEPNQHKSSHVQNLTITPDDRQSVLGECSVTSSMQENGEQKCFLAISVMCDEDENNPDCSYNLRVDQQGFNYTEHSSKAVEDFVPSPPQPILENEYVNGNVTYNKVKYYYLPVAREDYGNSLILLNKTQIYGYGSNGDSRMLINLQNNTSDDSDDAIGYKYSEWVYPNDNRAGAISMTLNNTWPELIEPCEEIMIDFCDNADGCTYIIGVAGGTNLSRSSYRIKGFRGHNKLHLNKPLVKENPYIYREGQDAFDYYWFVINDTVADPSVYFNYQVSVGSTTGQDPDLFISVMDGRWPNEDDYDFKSDIKGADSIQIASNDTFWLNNGWNTSAGVTVVVGVKQKEQGTYVLTLTSPNKPVYSIDEVERIRVGENVKISLPELSEGETRDAQYLFQLFNWGHSDFKFQLDINNGDGKAQLMYNTAGQDIVDRNVYQAIPINVNNSQGIIECDATNETIGSSNAIFVEGLECFNCWYFIKVQVDYPGAFEFTLSTPKMQDSAGITELRVNNYGQIYIQANFNANRKFLLNSKDNFILEATIASGEVTMYVGLDPDTLPEEYLWSATTDSNIASLSIKTTDKNFHVGTYYYVHLAAGQSNDALLNIHLKQQRSADFIPNNHDSTYELDHGIYMNELLFVKFQYQSMGEEIKFHVIQIPGTDQDGNQRNFIATITIEALTPHFYPQIYLKQVGFDEKPTDINTLEFPTIEEYDIAFGENPIKQLDNNRFVYTFKNVSDKLFAYYTMAIYQNNWQLTDYRKSEYQIKAQVDICNDSDCSEYGYLQVENAPVSSVESPVSSQNNVPAGATVKEDGSIWQWNLEPTPEVGDDQSSSEEVIQ